MQIITKSLAALAMITIAGAAQAQCPPTSDTWPPAGISRCALAAGFDQQHQEQYLMRIAGYLNPREASMLSGPIDSALYGGLADSADPAQVRRQAERSKLEDDAALLPKTVMVSIQVATRQSRW
jgi:hypothetical protein